MKIRVLSDLHLEFAPWKYEDAGEDVVVMAGDICDLSPKGIHRRMLLLHSIRKPVLVNLGNHEYYGKLCTKESAAQEHAQALSVHSNVTLLNPGTVTIGETVFVGATLWTNFLMCSDPDRLKAGVANAINDFQWMRAGPAELARTGPRANPNITSEDMLSWFVRDSMYIEKAIKDNPSKKVVVVTHFMAHPRGVASQYAGNILNGYFGSDMRHMMSPNVVAWVFGHTHTACEFMEGSTRVVCNPRAYPREVSGYDAKKVIEV